MGLPMVFHSRDCSGLDVLSFSATLQYQVLLNWTRPPVSSTPFLLRQLHQKLQGREITGLLASLLINIAGSDFQLTPTVVHSFVIGWRLGEGRHDGCTYKEKHRQAVQYNLYAGEP